MIVVSDTSPLNYLILLDCVDVLPELFQDVIAPSSVLNELLHPNAPDKVRNWADQPPNWLQVKTPLPFTPISNLHLGENEAIALALEVQARRLLIDERPATQAASQLGLELITTLSVLTAAGAKSLIDLDAVISQLRQTNFRAPAELLDKLIEGDRLRRLH